MYKTGDMAKWLPDGEIEFCGRNDNQVKIRGFRIELEEIENQLLLHKSIKEAIVITSNSKEGEQSIYAYVVLDSKINISIIRQHLKRNLAEYMIPSHIIPIKKIPLTPNGKLDKKSLLDPKQEFNLANDQSQTKSYIEKKLLKIWSEVIETQNISIDDNFFELGGNSLLIIQLRNKIERQFLVKINMENLFANPTIFKFSNYLENKLRLLSNEYKNTKIQIKNLLIKSTQDGHSNDISTINSQSNYTTKQLETLEQITCESKLDEKEVKNDDNKTYYRNLINSDLDKKLLNIWSEVVEIQNISINDNFFELGGNSLLIIQLRNKIERQFSTTINVPDLFANPTVSKFSEFLRSKLNVSEKKQNNILKNSYGSRKRDLQKMKNLVTRQVLASLEQEKNVAELKKKSSKGVDVETYDQLHHFYNGFLKFLKEDYFRAELINQKNLNELITSDEKTLFFFNHSGICGPYDSIIFDKIFTDTLSKIKNFSGLSLFNKKMKGISDQFFFKGPLGSKQKYTNVLKALGVIDQSDVLDIDHHFQKDQFFGIAPEGTDGQQKGFHKRYQLQKYYQSLIYFGLEHKMKLVPVSMINGEYLVPFHYTIPFINRLARTIFNIAFIPFGFSTPFHLFLPCLVFFALPAKLKYVIHDSIDPWKLTNQSDPFNTKELNRLKNVIQKKHQLLLNESVKKYHEPYDFQSFVKGFIKSKNKKMYNPLTWINEFAKVIGMEKSLISKFSKTPFLGYPLFMLYSKYLLMSQKTKNEKEVNSEILEIGSN